MTTLSWKNFEDIKNVCRRKVKSCVHLLQNFIERQKIEEGNKNEKINGLILMGSLSACAILLSSIVCDLKSLWGMRALRSSPLFPLMLVLLITSGPATQILFLFILSSQVSWLMLLVIPRDWEDVSEMFWGAQLRVQRKWLGGACWNNNSIFQFHDRC